MTTNLLFNVFDPCSPLQREVDRLFSHFDWPRTFPFDTVSNAKTNIVSEARVGQDDDNVYVEFAIPGAEPDSLKLSVEEGILRVAGTKAHFANAENALKHHRNERLVGDFTHRLRLPAQVDNEKVKADYRNGVLLVTLPKAAAAKPKQIEVRVA